MPCIIFGMFTAFEMEYADNMLSGAFYIQCEFWRMYKDKLNLAGMIIVEAVITIFLWPMNVLVLFVVFMRFLACKLWDFFLYLFRKPQ